jgi:hypothetical protein
MTAPMPNSRASHIPEADADALIAAAEAIIAQLESR